MSKTTKPLRRLGVALATAIVAMSIFAGAATAAVWTTALQVKVVGDLTFERPSAPDVTCSINSIRQGFLDDIGGPCTSGATASFWGALNPGGFTPWGAVQYSTPWGAAVPYWYMSAMQASWTEGNATTPSRLVFAAQDRGRIETPSGYEFVTISGELKITTPTGGLVTAP